MIQEPRIVGVVSSAVSKALGDDGQQYKAGDMIYIGESNVNHMKRRHFSAYNKYGDRLSNIISEPDYVGINEEDESLEYVKIFDDHVKLLFVLRETKNYMSVLCILFIKVVQNFS